MKRSHAPIFWSLFGAGGVLAALFGPILILITGILAPLDAGMPSGALSYARMLAFARHGLGKAIILALISLFLFHAAHRIYHTVHDFGVHGCTATKVAIYGAAIAGTVIAAGLLLSVGF